jgi:hypothetical protein
VRRFILAAGAAALLGMPSAHGQSAPTGTTGATGEAAPATAPDPQPRRQRHRTILAPAPPAAAPAAPTAPADLPVNARPGQCFARVAMPPAMETVQARVLVSPERKETRVTPAVYAEVEERVLVTPERVERVKIPATYRTATETVVVRPARTRVETVAPEYRTITEQVMVSPPRLEWRPEPPLYGPRPADPRPVRVGPAGEVWRLTEVPAVHETITRRVLVSPARQVAFTDPPVTRQVTRRVVDQPARVEERVIPAVHRTEKRRKLVQPERRETVVIPAEWRTVEQTRPAAGPPRMEWREAPCAKAVTPELVRRIQQALESRGHDVGRPDGVWGPRTLRALAAFQRARGLGVGALTLETLRELDIGA